MTDLVRRFSPQIPRIRCRPRRFLHPQSFRNWPSMTTAWVRAYLAISKHANTIHKQLGQPTISYFNLPKTPSLSDRQEWAVLFNKWVFCLFFSTAHYGIGCLINFFFKNAKIQHDHGLSVAIPPWSKFCYAGVTNNFFRTQCVPTFPEVRHEGGHTTLALLLLQPWGTVLHGSTKSTADTVFIFTRHEHTEYGWI